MLRAVASDAENAPGIVEAESAATECSPCNVEGTVHVAHRTGDGNDGERHASEG